MQNLIKQFNTPSTRLVISDYPEKTKNSERNYGIAWYTKELLEPLARNFGQKFVVLGETGTDNSPKLYQNGRILVLRIFDQKRPTLFPRILKALLTFNKIKEVDIHSEFCTNGGIRNFMLLLPFMLLIKLTGRHITYFSHNVVSNLNSIAPHLGYKKNSLTVRILNVGLTVFYKMLGLIVDRFVVMDEAIYKRLSLSVDPTKIFLHPFWIKKHSHRVSKKDARAELSVKRREFLLLYFGFITHYKGADWLIKAFKSLQKKHKFSNVRLILAGGEAYSLKDKLYYQKFYKKIVASVAKNKKIKITGFVPEDKISTYFSAADLVIFPYRGLIGSSGVMSHAISHQKPFIVSSAMSEVLDNKEIQVADLVFKHTTSSLETVLSKAMDTTHLKRLENLSKLIGLSRQKQKLVLDCYNQLYAPKNQYGEASLAFEKVVV